MKLSTRSRYGLRALLDIAVHEAGTPVRLREIARRQGVSLSYLEHIVRPLIAGEILRSTRGIHGGVSLARRPSDISVREAVTALEGGLVAT
ncbi:MAG: RrF2 family transcriptional regulator, partial [Chloroflexota bacterium]